MRLDSPLALALAGTIAIHLLVMTLGDALVVFNPPILRQPAPRIELFDVELPPVLAAPVTPIAPEEKLPEIVPEKAPEVVQAKQPVTRQAVRQPVTQQVETQPTTPTPTETRSGGEQVVTMNDIAPGATGVPVARGKRVGERIGRGGTGGGTGSGTGSGSGGDAPAPVSVATIKTAAKPKGDYGYFDARKEYPVEARQLAIEGAIKVKLIVDAEGKVKRAVLLTKLGHGLDELALARAQKIEFEPAKDTDDRAVASVVIWTFNMTLPK
ncbi:MAG: TonB family protein [Deltaproteobacteria bacterium]|nr:TonB family protein [Deltaproteobacteria bacterium]